jgi:predicted ribosome quality control (RQC) complex YloA/Tae2 family protein
MDNESIQEIVNEIAPLLIGRAPGKIFQFGPAVLAVDFGLRHQGYLFISAEPSLPRIYLIKRRVRDLERQGAPLNQFGLGLRKELANTKLVSIAKDAGDRVVRLRFVGEDVLGKPKQRTIIAQLTGRSANLLLLDERQTIIHAARPTDIVGQRIGESYTRPSGEVRAQKPASNLLTQIRSRIVSSLSEAADTYYTGLLTRRESEANAEAARAQVRKKISQQEKLLKQLESDLRNHANADQHKRIGDLLLANISTAKRKANRVALIDYFSDDDSSIEIELDDSVSLQQEAARRFRLYSRSKRAVAQIMSRIDGVKKRICELQSEQESLERVLSVPPAVAGGFDSSAQRTFDSSPALQRWDDRSKLSSELALAGDRKSPQSKRIPGTRRYLSSDDFEILVGRTSKDNDHLTFKIATPNDLWLHAADYRGSHVVIRRPTRKEVPHQTIIEAAQLAAWFSQAKKDPKVDVHYTERKFVSKPKGSKPGLVRLQRFKNITVVPKEAGIRQ